jgi:hypothetical protein
MIATTYRLALCVALSTVVGATFSQDENSAAGAEHDDGATTNEWREKCFLVPAVMDLQVLSDRHVYVRTRGGNHYILATEQCENLERSYVRSEVQLMNYGRRVCEHDGSYLLYNTGTRVTTCGILTIDPVADRAEAKLIAAGDSDLVEIKVIDPGDSVDRAAAPALPAAPPD